MSVKREVLPKLRHGHRAGKASPTYKSWRGMRERCSCPKRRAYKYYGSRGITVCERWQKFENFLADMGEAPKGWTIDRIDNDGNYEPGNCRWATQSEQNRNKRGTKINLEIARAILARFRNGEPRRDIALAYGVSRSTVKQIGAGCNWPDAGFQ